MKHSGVWVGQGEDYVGLAKTAEVRRGGRGAVLGYAMASSDGLRYAELSWVGGMGALAGWWRRAEINEWEMRALFGWGGISGTPSCDAAG